MGATRIGIGLLLFLFINLYTNYADSFPLSPTLFFLTDNFQQNGSENEMGRSLYVQGKANLVPVYAAGQHRRKSHRSSANCRQSSAGLLSVVISTALASLLAPNMVF